MKLRHQPVGPVWAALAEEKERAEARLQAHLLEGKEAERVQVETWVVDRHKLLKPLPVFLLSCVPYLHQVAESSCFRELLVSARQGTPPVVVAPKRHDDEDRHHHGGGGGGGGGGAEAGTTVHSSHHELACIVSAICEWGMLYDGLNKMTLSLKRAVELFQHFLSDTELHLLIRTGPAALRALVVVVPAAVGHDRLDAGQLVVGEPNNLWVFRVRKHLHRVKYIMTVKNHIGMYVVCVNDNVQDTNPSTFTLSPSHPFTLSPFHPLTLQPFTLHP